MATSSSRERARGRRPGAPTRRAEGSRGATRERLLEVGVMALRRGGYHGTGLADLLASAALPKGSFYHYFPSKEAFALEAVQSFGERVLAELERQLSRHPDDPLRGLQSYFLGLCRQYAQENSSLGCLLGNFGQEIAASNRRVAEAVHVYLGALRSRFASAISEAQRRGRARSDLDAGTLADWLANGWHGALIQMKVQGSTSPARRFVRTFFGFLREDA